MTTDHRVSWVSHFNGFNYEEFYEFIVDFFEADQMSEGKAASKELCDWWDRYVSGSISIVIVIEPSQGSLPKVCCYSGSLGVAVVACGPTRAAPSLLAPLAILVPFRVAFVVTLIYSTQYYRSLNLAIQYTNRGIPTARIRVLWVTLLWGYGIQYNFYET